jgi:hypothetical protein
MFTVCDGFGTTTYQTKQLRLSWELRQQFQGKKADLTYFADQIGRTKFI